ncbi:MAG TPA: cytochrome P450, partial [Solirubrobacteraceae bacterium]
RCLGASFAMLEMKTALRAVLERFDVRPAAAAPEAARRRSITISPAGGAAVILHDRPRRTAPGVTELHARHALAPSM